jgi:hypothetical protein
LTFAVLAGIPLGLGSYCAVFVFSWAFAVTGGAWSMVIAGERKPFGDEVGQPGRLFAEGECHVRYDRVEGSAVRRVLGEPAPERLDIAINVSAGSGARYGTSGKRCTRTSSYEKGWNSATTSRTPGRTVASSRNEGTKGSSAVRWCSLAIG